MPENSEKIDAELFKTDFETNRKNFETFKKLVAEKDSDWNAISAELSKKGFEPQLVQKLQFTNNLTRLLPENERLIKYFQKNSETNSLGDIALNLDYEKLKQAIIVSDTEIKEAEVAKLVTTFQTALFREVPTQKIINIISENNDLIERDDIRKGVSDFLKKQPDSFKITESSLDEAFNVSNAFEGIAPEIQEEVKNEVKSWRRIAAISPTPGALAVSIKNNLTSAMQISDIPEVQFVQTYSKSLGENGVEVARQLHANAVNTRIRNEQALLNLKETVSGTGIAFIDKSLNFWKDPQFLKHQFQKHDLSWDLLFGDTDYCECGECTSVYSASAYFVELLQYLRNNNLDPSKIKIKPTDISNTPLEKLFQRRPDLGCLELTCKNTNTILPYVDLVNEVMESYVVHQKTKHFNVKDETSTELLAEPQHTEIKAYNILHKAVFPFTLPYHQPIDSARIYLDSLKTSRTELIDIFRSSFDDKSEIVYDNQTPSPVSSFTANQIKELQDLHSDFLNRAFESEYLGLTQEEYIILTKEAFVTKKFWEKQTKKTYAEKVYQNKIGVLPVHEYYGYSKETEMLNMDESKKDGLTFVKDQFLPRTGIEYKDLVKLLETKNLNPSLPREKDLTILKKIRFSYEFLQSMIEPAAGPNKYKKLIEFIKENQPTAQIDPCNPTSIETPLSEIEIEEWVKTTFVEIGQSIVLERVFEKKEVPTFKCSEGKFEPLSPAPIVIGSGGIEIRDASGEILIKEKTNHELDELWNLEVSVNKDFEIILNGKGNKKEFDRNDNTTGLPIFKSIPLTITDEVIGGINCSTGELFGKTFRGKQVSFLWNSWKFTSKDGREGKMQYGFLVMEETVVQDVSHQIIPETCDIAKIRLKHLDGSSLRKEELDNIQRFIRLWRKLGWTIDEVESAIIAFSSSGNPPEINSDLLRQLKFVKELQEKTGLELTKLLTFWTNINTYGENSLYSSLFLSPNLIHLDPVFKPDEDGIFLGKHAQIGDHIPALLAAFKLSNDDLEKLLKDLQIQLVDEISLANLSSIYRNCLLAKTLNLRISAFLSLKDEKPFSDPFKNAQETVRFIDEHSRLDNAGFDFRKLNYLFTSEFDSNKSLSLSEKTTFQLTKTIFDGLNAIDSDHRDNVGNPQNTVAEQYLEIQTLSTTEVIRNKALLFFDSDTADKIIDFLNGSSAFVASLSARLTIKVNDSLKTKLRYDLIDGTFQVIGILTENEELVFLAANTDPEWSTALDSIKKQQTQLFNQLFSNLFEVEKAISDDRKVIVENAEIILKSGDTEDRENPNGKTAPQKRAEFLKVFLPFLRRELSRHFIIEKLSDALGLDKRTTDILVTDKLKNFNIFEGVRNSANATAQQWEGYLIPSKSDSYTLIVKNDDEPKLGIDQKSYGFTEQNAAEDQWWSDAAKLEANKIYELSVKNFKIAKLFWKTPSSAIVPVSDSVLLPKSKIDEVRNAFIPLHKIAVFLSTLKLSIDEVSFFADHRKEFFNPEIDNFDINSLQIKHLIYLEKFVSFRDSLPKSKYSLIEFLDFTFKTSKLDEITKMLSELTLWSEKRIEKLISPEHFNFQDAFKFRIIDNLLMLQEALSTADKVGFDIDLLFEWAKPTANFEKNLKISSSIQSAFKAQYNQTDWEQIVKPLNDKLRNNQKNALVSYLLQQPELIKWGVTDADGLFEFFLIDVQMQPCMETSRIKQGISSIQLFVQRCFLGLEEGNSGIKPSVLDRKRWEWMQRYRVWEANRKVFLYPENWIESNLRDDKSPFFKELESELLQKDINKQSVEDALKDYLYKVDEVANLEVVGLYIEGEKSTDNSKSGISWSEGSRLHIFSRTRNSPYFFFYRHLDLDKMFWFPWEKIQVDIPSYDGVDSVVVIPENTLEIPKQKPFVEMEPKVKWYPVRKGDKKP